MASLKQTSFSSGIVSTQLIGETDQAKYTRSLRECINAIIQRFGGVQNRAGLVYDDALTTFGAGTKMRLVKFVFNYSKSYQLVFCNNLIIPYKNNARVIAGSDGTPALPYNAGTTYGNGEFVTYGGNVYRALVGTNIGHQPDISPTYWDVQAGGLVSIKTVIPYTALAQMITANVNDIMTITHQSIYPQQLIRYSDSRWAIANFAQLKSLGIPVGSLLAISQIAHASGADRGVNELYATGGNTALTPSTYAVTSYNGVYTNFPSFPATAQGGVDGTHSIVLNWDLQTGGTAYTIYRRVGAVFQAIGATGAGVNTFTDTNIAPGAPIAFNDPFRCDYVVTSINDLTGSESLQSLVATATGSAAPTVAAPNLISWNAVIGCNAYNIYKLTPNTGGVFGYIGTATLSGSLFDSGTPLVGLPKLTFNDTGLIPLTNIQPPVALPLFATANDYPAVCAYFQQRQWFANTINQPMTVTGSQVGNFANFNTTIPVIDSGAVQFVVAADEAQPVTALIDLGKFIIHTANAEFMASGNVYGTITPTAPNLVRQGSFGSALLKPIVIGNSDIFIQTRGNQARDLKYDIQSYGYTGKDLSIFASDLFQGRQIIDMDWQNIPDSVIWMVLDNGVLVGLTYVREHDIWAWHEHAFTNGYVEAVSVVPTGTKDVVSLIVRRTINSATARYLEHFAVREYMDTTWFTDVNICDCSLVYDGRNTTATQVQLHILSGGWLVGATFSLLAGAPLFIAADDPNTNPQGIGNTYVLRRVGSDGIDIERVYCTVVQYINDTQVTVIATADIPAFAQNIAITTWGKAVHAFSGIGHLEGQSISLLGDGNVIASPLNVNPTTLVPNYPIVTVVSGAFTLPNNVMVLVAGLPIQMDVQTMPVENAQGETIANKTVNVKECCPIFYRSRGGQYGQDQYHLHDWKQPRAQPPAVPAQGLPTQPWTGPVIVPIQGSPQLTGQLWIRQVDPLPWGVSGIIVDAEVGR